MKKLFIILLFLIINVYAQDSLNSHKTIGSISYFPNSHVILLKDSTLIDGYLFFEAHKKPDDKFYMYDSTFYIFELFFVHNLEDVSNYSKRCYFNASYLLYVHADTFGYDTGKGDIIITKDVKNQFLKFKKFYLNYISIRDWAKDKYFLMGKLNSGLFTMLKDSFWKFDNDSISYFIFKVKFYSAILNYSAYYFKKPSGRGYVENTCFFLPVGKPLIFEPIESEKLLNFDFSKSKWFPENLFK